MSASIITSSYLPILFFGKRCKTPLSIPWSWSLGASVVLLLSAMGSIPQPLYESARLDGSRRWDEFRFITMPLLKPTLLYLAVLNTIASFQVFSGIYLLTNGGPNNSTTTLAFSIFRSGFIQYQFGYASAQAAIMFIILLIITVVYFRLLSDDVEY